MPLLLGHRVNEFGNRIKDRKVKGLFAPNSIAYLRRSSSDPDPKLTERSFVFPKFRV